MKLSKTIFLLLLAATTWQNIQAQVVSTFFDGNNVASFYQPIGVAVDASGNVYVADANNHKIRKISPSGVVSTLAGSGTSGSTDGEGTAASFNYPQGVAVDASGNVYVADYFNNKIRKISPAGTVSTLAGSGTRGSTDGAGTAASFNYPQGVAVDASGNVYVADRSNNKIRKISSTGVVSILAGNGTRGSTNGTGTAASFSSPAGVAIDASGNVYVADQGNQKIRKISIAGAVSTLAGSGTFGSTNGTGTAASFGLPTGVAIDASGNVYVADQGNQKIRKISPSGVVSTLAGSGTQGSTDGTGTAASFSNPTGVAVDASGNVYVADGDNNKIRKISPAGVVSTLAGSGTQGSTDGTGTAASFKYPHSVAVDASGNVFVADADDNRIRKISPAGVVSNLAGTGSIGSTDGTGMAASFNYPSGVAVDASGNVYVADKLNNKIRKISPASVVSTMAGSGTFGSSDGIGAAVSFTYPDGVTVDASGNVYVADAGNNKIRKMSPFGEVSTLAGSGTGGSADGLGTAASFNAPTNVAVDASGNVYVADSGNKKIRKISPSGVVSTLAGSGYYGSTDEVGTLASFSKPTGVAVDASGNVYVADYENNKIRKIRPNGVVSTMAGSGTFGSSDGIGAAASFYYPYGVAVDASGNIYVADYGNKKIRKITMEPNGLSDITIASHTELASVYPNPSNGIIQIELSNLSSSYSVRVSNSTGITVYSSPLTTANHQLNTSSLGAKGLYFVQILDNNKVMETKKLVVE